MPTIVLNKDQSLLLKDPNMGVFAKLLSSKTDEASISIEGKLVGSDDAILELQPEAFDFWCQSSDNERTRTSSAAGKVVMKNLDSAKIRIGDIRLDYEDLPLVLDSDKHFKARISVNLTSKGTSRKLKNEKNEDVFSFQIVIPRLDTYADMKLVFDTFVYQPGGEPVQVGRLLVKHSSADRQAAPIAINALRLSTSQSGKPMADDMMVTFAGGKVDLPTPLVLKPTDSEPLSFPLYWKPMWDRNPAPDAPLALTVGATCAYGSNIDYAGGTLKVDHNPNLVNFSASISIPTRHGSEAVDMLRNTNAPLVPLYELDRAANVKFKIDLDFACSAREQFRASAIVWDLQAGVPTGPDADRLVMAPGHTPASAFALHTASTAKPVRHIRHDSPLRASITIESAAFKKIIPSDTSSAVELTIPISFKCFLDQDGNYPDSLPQAGGDTHKFNLRIRLRMRPSDNWLSIDFGTSAIVARHQHRLLNLLENKRRLYRLAFPSDTNKQQVTEPDNMINSNICFNRASRVIYTPAAPLDALSFKDLQLHLSPSAGTSDVSAQLPCLKLLMGYRSISDIFGADILRQFNLRMPDGSNAYLMDIANIFELVYRQLFNLYINDIDINSIHRLILSVPNTYTPIQIARLRDIARKVFTEVYPEHLDTISESDAVAYYYAANREAFRGHDPYIEKESVLIYDMGAGTLDLTYLTITRTRQKTIVDVIGKSGTAMAGNYLDYVLAQAFADLCEQKGALDAPSLKKLRALLDVDDTRPDVRLRSTLREFVRNVLKPAISDPDLADTDLRTLTTGGKDIFQLLAAHDIRGTGGTSLKITIGEVASHPLFKSCLDEITTNLLADFARRLRIDLKNDVDTVIFSGRSSSMTQIRRRVKDALHPGARYANLGTMSLEEDLQPISSREVAILKNIVSEGTIAFANLTHQDGEQHYELRRKAFYATYGVIVQDENGAHASWLPFDLKPDPQCPGTFTATVDMTISAPRNVLKLVQTYSSAPIENESMTTTLYSCKQNNGNIRLTLCLNPADENLLSFQVGAGQIELGARAQDLNSPALRKSLWPIVFDKKG